MRILVTGGLGAVGSYVVRALRDDGHDVWTVSRRHHWDPQHIRADVAEFRQLTGAFSEVRPDLVYHMAAEFGRWNGERYFETMWRSNAVGTKTVIGLCQEFDARLIFFSSSEVYGDYDGPMSEEVMDQYEIRQMNDYALSKWVGEQQVMNAMAAFEIEAVRVRLFNTYGPGEGYSRYRSANCIFAFRSIFGLPFTVYRGHLRTSTFVEDTARTLANIAGNFISGRVYNIGGTDLHSMEDVAAALLQITGASPSIVDYRDPEPHTTLKKVVDCELARQELAHQSTTSLYEGLEQTVTWMRSHYRLSPRDIERMTPESLAPVTGG